jgi:hypothetical protein
VAAAPHLLDDPELVSPELALVDADLSAQLRATLPDSTETLVTMWPADADSPMLEDGDDQAARFARTPDVALDPVTEAVAAVADLPDYVIAPVPGAVVVTAADVTTEDVPEFDAVPERTEENISQTDDAEPTSTPAPSATFPTLPSLDLRQDALDDTDTALRKIRDQLGVDARSGERPRLRRRFVVLGGIAAIAALTALAADSHPHFVQLLPGWLGL